MSEVCGWKIERSADGAQVWAMGPRSAGQWRLRATLSADGLSVASDGPPVWSVRIPSEVVIAMFDLYRTTVSE